VATTFAISTQTAATRTVTLCCNILATIAATVQQQLQQIWQQRLLQ